MSTFAARVDPTAPNRTHCDPPEAACAFDLTSFEPGDTFGIDGPVIVCAVHKMPGPGEVYLVDPEPGRTWLLGEALTLSAPPPQCGHCKSTDPEHVERVTRPGGRCIW